jgi:hypothetical protein
MRCGRANGTDAQPEYRHHGNDRHKHDSPHCSGGHPSSGRRVLGRSVIVLKPPGDHCGLLMKRAFAPQTAKSRLRVLIQYVPK